MKSKSLSTKEKAVIIGMELVQKHGYHGFSFQNVADRLRLKKPSLYEHFRSKEDLISAIIAEYTNEFRNWTQRSRELPTLRQVAEVFSVFQMFVNDGGKICPILALATDSKTLSFEVQKDMQEFISSWVHWLEKQLLAGQIDGSIRRDMSAKVLASLIYSQGMGAQFQSRVRGGDSHVRESATFVIEFIKNLSA